MPASATPSPDHPVADIEAAQIVAPFGPYHRLEATFQTVADADRQTTSGEIRGRPARYSHIAKVKAYAGPLPPGARGIEFFTFRGPNAGTRPHVPEWYLPNPGVWEEDGFAKIRCRVVRNTQR